MIQAGWPQAMRLDLVCTGSATSRTPNAAQTQHAIEARLYISPQCLVKRFAR